MLKTLGKTKENQGPLEVPLCDVREGMRGERMTVTVSQKSSKTLENKHFLCAALGRDGAHNRRPQDHTRKLTVFGKSRKTGGYSDILKSLKC